MNRREAIKRTSLMLGVAVSSPAVISLLNGCTPKKTLNWKPVFFTEEQAFLVADIAETILPKTDTPGAKDIGVDAFIDFMVNTCYDKNQKAHFLEGLQNVEKQSDLLDGNSFSKLSTAQKSEVLTSIENEEVHNNLDSIKKEWTFFSHIKELTLLGYFTSEEIMTQYLEYVPVPTRLEGCMNMEENQKLIVGNHV